MSRKLTRTAYAEIYGPTTGDRIRLADTALIVEVEKDYTVYGDECKFGGGKVLRDGMGQAVGVPEAEALDTVITNALVIDYTGVYKADVGLKDGLIAGVGKAGNPHVMDGVRSHNDRGSDHGSHRRRRAHSHRRRHRFSHTFHMPSADL